MKPFPEEGRQDRPEVLSNLFLNPYNKTKSIYQAVFSKAWFTVQKMKSKSTFNLSRWNQFSLLQGKHTAFFNPELFQHFIGLIASGFSMSSSNDASS